MGTTTNRIPMVKLRRNMCLLLKLLAIIVIIQASGINAKQLATDLTFDDTFDIDQFDDASASSTKLRHGRDLDKQAFIEDELQPVEKSDGESSSNDGSWLMQSVKRVRRELGRLFGSEEKKLVESKKYAKTITKAEKLRKRQDKLAEKQKRKALAAHVAETNRSKNRLNKRQSYDDVEGSGDDNETYGEHDMWQTLFTISEPWQEQYHAGKGHKVFNDLHQQIEIAFHDFVNQNYDNDEDNYLQTTLIRVEPTNDIYKIHCIVQVDLPERWSDFGQRLRQYLLDYKRFGQEFSADADSSFYFRRVRELQEHESVDVTTDYSHNADDHRGEGVDNNHGHHYGAGEDSESHHRNAAGTDDYERNAHPNFGECDDQGYFHCRNNQVIDCAYRCDNKADCDDDSDEEREMCDKYFVEDEDEEDLEGNEVGNHGAAHHVDPYGEATETPHDNGNNGYDDRYGYDREQEMERERQRQAEQDREREEQDRARQYEEERAREEAERSRQYELEQEERNRQYELEEQERVRQQQEREENERRGHENDHDRRIDENEYDRREYENEYERREHETEESEGRGYENEHDERRGHENEYDRREYENEYDRREHEREEQERREHERAEQERREREREEQERREHEREQPERHEHENEYDRREYENEYDRREHEREEQERREREREEQERREREREEQERRDHEREQPERHEYENEYDRREYENEYDRREREREEQERREREREEHERRGHENEHDRREYGNEYDRPQFERGEHDRRDHEREEHDRRDHEREEHDRRDHEREEHERREHDYHQPTHNQDGERHEQRELYDCSVNPNGYFACHSGEIVPCYNVCDNQIDCQDGSDEDECRPDITTEEAPAKPHSESESHYGQDFEASGEDYAPVSETSPVYTSQYDVGCRGDTTFTCPESGRTICEEQLCDGEEHCPDGEDEMNCRSEGEENNGYDGDTEYEPDTQCEEYEFKCDNRCLPKEYLCNGIHECFDKTDELNCAEKEKPLEIEYAVSNL